MKRTLLASCAVAPALALALATTAGAADLFVKAPVVAPIIYHWDGAYVSLSAGSTWTDVKTSEFDSLNDTLAISVTGLGALSATFPYTYTDSMSGKETGAVFTFTTGYNWVWGSVVLGVQSEVSYNTNEVHVSGTGANRATLGPFGPLTITDTRNGDVSGNIKNNWTVSEMARVGWLLTPSLQVYGLVGWSWGGFTFDGYSAGQTGLQAALGVLPIIGLPFSPAGRNDVASVTLNGFTWGAGVEKDFGWMRGFIQYKGINYNSKDVSLAANASGALTFAVPAGALTISDSVVGQAVRAISADVNQVTAGITIPLSYGR